MPSRGPKIALPIYDDFGNTVAMPPETRTYERKIGCWNCIHADRDIIYRQRVVEAARRDAAVYQHRDGLSMHQAKMKANATRQLLLAKIGTFVVCTKGMCADLGFVACKHLCTQWSGTTGVLGSLEPGKTLDELVGKLYEDHGEAPTGGLPGTPEPPKEN